ncbi:MAG: hypothetical protein SGJ19_27960 [Planctomycetia bacterium]|nr:hypothetical protein [Planctomycetia bacterium]
MQRQITIFALSILTLHLGTSSSVAVDLTVRPVVRQLQHPDLTPLAPGTITVQNAEQLRVAEGTGPLLVTLDYYVSISQLAGGPGELGFGNVVVNLQAEGLSLDPLIGGWSPDLTLVDTNGEELGGLEAIWSDNADFGASGTDLQSIIVGLAPSGFGDVGVDPRRTLAQFEPALMGSTTFQWDPNVSSTASLNVDVKAFSVYNVNLQLRERVFGGKFGGSMLLDVGTGQNGDTDADGDVDISDLNNVRNHFDEAGEGVVGDTAPLDGVVDINDLNRVRDNFGESLLAAGGLTAVPEPATAGLAVCGLIALAGYRHRRRHA